MSISLPLVSTLLAEKKHNKWTTIIIGILGGMTLLSIVTTIILILRRNKVDKISIEDSRLISGRSIANKTISSKYSLHKEFVEGNLKCSFRNKCNIWFKYIFLVIISFSRQQEKDSRLFMLKYWCRFNFIWIRKTIDI